jgi:hypothetical protein
MFLLASKLGTLIVTTDQENRDRQKASIKIGMR